MKTYVNKPNTQHTPFLPDSFTSGRMRGSSGNPVERLGVKQMSTFELAFRYKVSAIPDGDISGEARNYSALSLVADSRSAGGSIELE